MRPVPALLVLLALVHPVGAEHCTTWSSTPANLTLDTYYFYWDFCQPDCGPNVWIYEESNGIPSMQRGDEQVDDTCHGMIPSDKIVF